MPSDKADQTKKHAGAFKGATSKVRAKGRPRPPKAETEDELEFDFAEKGPDEEESGDDITEEPDVVPDTEEPLPSQGQVEPVMSLPHDVDGDTSNNSTVSSSKRSWRGLKAHPSTQKRSLKRQKLWTLFLMKKLPKYKLKKKPKRQRANSYLIFKH